MLMVPVSKRKYFLTYCFVSYISTVLVIYSTFCNSTSYLSASIRLLKGIPLVLMCNFTLVNGLLIWQLAINLLFGELRLIETEHIFENLGFTIFNGILISSSLAEKDFFPGMLLIILTIFMRVFHWILSDRLDQLYNGSNSNLPLRKYIFSKFHFNLLLFLIVDFNLAKMCFDKSSIIKFFTNKNPSIVTYAPFYLIFSQGFSVMFIGLLNILANSMLNLYEAYRSKLIARSMNAANAELDDELVDEEPFENKYRWQVSIDIVTSTLKMALRLFLIFPLNFPIVLIKDLVFDALGLFNNSKKLYSILKNSHKLNDLLPDCNPEDILDEEDLCTICMESLLTSQTLPKKLPCNHILHLSCLKHWLERSQTCPICRVDVFDEKGNLADYTNTRAARPTPTTQIESNDNVPNVTGTTDVLEGVTEDTEIIDNAASEVERINISNLNSSAVENARQSGAYEANLEKENSTVWIPYEITPESKRIVFQDINGNSLNAVLRKRARSECDTGGVGLESHKIVIPDIEEKLYAANDSTLQDKSKEEEIETLKRKIEDLQNQLDEFTYKKSKRE